MNNKFPIYRDLLNYSAIAITPQPQRLSGEDYNKFYPIFIHYTKIVGMIPLEYQVDVEIDGVSSTPILDTINDNFEYFDKIIAGFDKNKLIKDYVKVGIMSYDALKKSYKLFKLVEDIMLKVLIRNEFEIDLKTIFTEEDFEDASMYQNIIYKNGKFLYCNKETVESDIRNEVLKNLKNINEISLFLEFYEALENLKSARETLDSLELD